MTTYYPVYLNLRGRRCVIVGGGAVAEGKISRLLDSGAKICVVSPDATAGIQQFEANGAVRWEQRTYRPGDLEGAFIAIAATNVREVNRRIFEEAEERGVMLNAVDDPPNCSFIAPSIVQRGPVTLAISTGGVSPALARKLRESLQHSAELAWADLSGVMAVARSHLREAGLLSTIGPATLAVLHHTATAGDGAGRAAVRGNREAAGRTDGRRRTRPVQRPDRLPARRMPTAPSPTKIPSPLGRGLG